MAQQARKARPYFAEVEAEIQWHRENGSNILVPTTKIETNEFCRPVVDEVTLSIEQGDAYQRKDSRGNVKYALTLQGLNRIGTCAGIRWDPRETRRIDDASDKLYIAYKAVGAIVGPDGSMIENSAAYDLDLEVVREEIEEQHWYKCKNWKKSEQEKKDYVKYATERDWRQKRNNRLALAESGAKARVLRQLFGFKNLYTKQELDKPFVILRYIYQLPPEDPFRARKQVANSPEENIRQIYGPPSQPAAPPRGTNQGESVPDTGGEEARRPDKPDKPDKPDEPGEPARPAEAAPVQPAAEAKAPATDARKEAEAEATPKAEAEAGVELLDEAQWEDATKPERIAEIKHVAEYVGYDLEAFTQRAGAELQDLDGPKLARLYQNLCGMVQ